MDLVGKKIGKLYVIEKTKEKEKSNHEYKYRCICDCGKEKLIRGSNLKSNNSKSCGCENIKKVATISKGYRNKNRRLYNIYQNMKQRCYYKKSIGYKNYGGRGIKVCDEWKNDYVKFYEWSINNGYKDNLTIDRININGIYEPNNCRWITRKEQNNNMRTNRYITYNNQTKTIAQWAETLNMSPQKLKYRIDHWSIEKAFNK